MVRELMGRRDGWAEPINIAFATLIATCSCVWLASFQGCEFLETWKLGSCPSFGRATRMYQNTGSSRNDSNSRPETSGKSQSQDRRKKCGQLEERVVANSVAN